MALAPSTNEANTAKKNMFDNIIRRSLTTLDSCLNKVKEKSIQNKTRDLANRQLLYNQTYIVFLLVLLTVFQRSVQRFVYLFIYLFLKKV